MALVSRKEFAKLAGIGYKNLNVYIGRGKIATSGDFIDTEFSINYAYLASRGIDGLNIGVADSLPSPKSDIIEKKVVKIKTYSEPIIKEQPVKEAKELVYEKPIVGNHVALDLEKKALEIEKLKKQNRVLASQAAKLEGALIPTELVKSVIIELSEAMKIAYSESIETYTVIVGAQKKLTNDEISNIKKHFSGLINDTIKKQIEIAKKMISSIVDEYSETRGRGERK